MRHVWLRPVALIMLLVPVQSVRAQAPPQQTLTYSVQVAAYTVLQQAQDLVSRQNSAETPFFVVPVDVNGQTYFRVLAGLFPERGEAVALMLYLVERGIKDSAADWHIKDASQAVLLGSYGSEAESRTAVGEAAARGVPSYGVPSVGSSGLEYRVYAGGFANAAEATALRGILATAGGQGNLVPREGLTHAQAAEVALAEGQGAVQQEAQQQEAVQQQPPPPPDEEVVEPQPAARLDSVGAEVQEPAVVPAREEEQLPQTPPQPAQTTPPVPGGRGVSLGFAAMGGALPGQDEYHLFGGGLVHPRMGPFGLLASGMYGTGGSYESLAGFGALSIRFFESGDLALSAFFGYGYYQEKGAGESRDVLAPTGGGLVTVGFGGAELIGAFTGMVGTFEEGSVAVDLELIRFSVGLGFNVAGGR